MPEKTLKESTFAKASVDEKVERARRTLECVEVAYRHIDLTEAKEALTALEEELQHAREALSWIPVSERLPESDAEFLCTYIDMDGYESVDKFWFKNGRFMLDRIIAWRYIPDPYNPPVEIWRTCRQLAILHTDGETGE